MWTKWPPKLTCLLLSSVDASTWRETDRHGMLYPIWHHQFCAHLHLQVQHSSFGSPRRDRCIRWGVRAEIALALCRTKQIQICFWEKGVVCSTCPLPRLLLARNLTQVYGAEHTNRWNWCGACSWSSEEVQLGCQYQPKCSASLCSSTFLNLWAVLTLGLLGTGLLQFRSHSDHSPTKWPSSERRFSVTGLRKFWRVEILVDKELEDCLRGW